MFWTPTSAPATFSTSEFPAHLGAWDIRGPDPVDAIGRIRGVTWYFRGKGRHFQVHLACRTSVGRVFEAEVFYLDLEWPGDAGKMHPQDITRAVEYAVALYQDQTGAAQ